MWALRNPVERKRFKTLPGFRSSKRRSLGGPEPYSEPIDCSNVYKRYLAPALKALGYRILAGTTYGIRSGNVSV